MADILNTADPFARLWQPAPQPVGGNLAFDPAMLPSMNMPKRNLFAAGLSAGVDELQGLGGSALQATGKLTGWTGLEGVGADIAQRNAAEAAANGRADLEVAPWRDGGGGLAGTLPWLGYQAAKQVPQIAGALIGGALVPEAIVPAALGRLGASVPAILGGGRGLAGEAAAAAGKGWAKELTGATIAGYPVAAGSMYQQATEREQAGGGEATAADAAKAFALGPIYSALDAIQPAQLKGLAKRGSAGNIFQRISTAGAAGALQEMPTEAVQTAMELSFRPDMSTKDKMAQIVDAAITGGAVGGVFGGAGGIRRLKTVSPNAVTNEDLQGVADAAVNPQLEGPPPALALPAPPKPPPSVADVFAGVPDEKITQFRATAEDAIAKGEGTPEMEQQLRLLRSEEARRQAGTEAAQPTLGGLFPEADLQQPSATPAEAPATTEAPAPAQDAVAATRAKAVEMAGGKAQWINKLEVSDDVGLADAVLTRLENGAEDNKTFKIAERLGLVDAKGNERDLVGELAAAQQKVARAELGALNNPTGVRALEDAQSEVQNIQLRMEVLQSVQQRRAGGSSVEQQAALAGTPPTATRPAPASTTTQPDNAQAAAPVAQDGQTSLDLTFGRQPENVVQVDRQGQAAVTQQAPAPAPATFSAAKDFVKGIVGRSNTVIANLDAKNPTEIVQETLNGLATRKPNQTFTKIGEYFGLVQNGKKVDLPTAIANTETQVNALKEQINKLPVSAAPRSRALAAQIGPLQEKLDALKSVQGQAAVTPTDTPAGPTAVAARNQISSDEQQAEAIALRERMRTIQNDRAVPPAVRRSAQIAGQKLREGRVDAVEAANTAIADHAAVTQTLGIPSQSSLTSEEQTRATDHPEWAVKNAQEINGEIVHTENDGLALARVVSGRGKRIYVAVMPTTHGRFDVNDAINEKLLAKSDLQKLRDARTLYEAEEMSKAAAHPEGPFENKPLGTNVVGSASMDPRMTGFAADLMQQLGLGNVNLFLFHPEDVRGNRDAYNLHGDYFGVMQAGLDASESGSINNFGPKGKSFYISMSPNLTTAQAIEVLSHEIGHMVDRTQYANASPETKAAIKAEFERWLQRAKGMTGSEIIRALRNTETAEMQAQQMGPNPSLDNRYWLGFDEWFADNVSKWTTTSAKPVSLVEKFFAGVGAKLRQLMGAMSNSFGRRNNDSIPAPAMKAFLDSLGPLNSFQWAGPSAVNGRSQSAAVGLTPQRLNEASMRVHDLAGKVFEKFDGQDLTSGARKLALGWSSVGHIITRFSNLFPQIKAYAEAHQARAGASARLSQLFSNAYYKMEQLEKANPKAAELTRKLMSMTEFRIDPRKTWAQHPWLHKEPNAVKLRERVEQANKDYSTLRQTKQNAAYEELHAVNDTMHYASMAVSMYNLVASDPLITKTIRGFNADPMDQFRERAQLHESPEAARDYWKGVLDAQVVASKEFVQAQQGEAATKTTAKDRESITRRITPLELRMKSIEQSTGAMAEAPYFHLGRFGEHFVSFDMRVGEDKNVDPKAIEHVARVLDEAGFKSIQISTDSTKPHAFVRLENEGQTDTLYRLMLKLKKEGWLNKDKEVARGLRSEGKALDNISPEWLKQYLETLQADPAFEPTEGMSKEQAQQLRNNRERMVSIARELWLDMLPDTAISKVLSHRDSVPGYTKDMMRNYAFRMQVGVNALANLSSSAKLSKAFVDMRSAINDAKVNPDLKTGDVVTMQNIFSELTQRETDRPYTTGKNFVDTARAFNHAYFLGASPSYVAVNMTQLGVLLWPELAKKHGYVEAAKAIAKVTPAAFRIMKATVRSGLDLGAKRAADAVVTEAVLKKAGLSEREQEFLMRVINTGNIDIGSASRELGRVADGSIDSKTDVALRYAAAAGYYSETFTRLIAALSARELHGEKAGLDDYANSTINESMLNYSTWNTARQMGKLGIAGKYTPVMFSFMQYQAQVIEKLYRELAVAFIDKDASPEAKSEARKFLAYHSVAMTALAGSLGMPIATVIVRAIEKLKDLFDDDEDGPFDAKAAYRNFLSDLVGKDIAEVIARGLPRAFGIDLSGRVGEQDILPFSRLLTDRRKWEDASKDWAMNTLGSPVSMLSNLIQGGRDIGRGDVLSGLKEFMPVAIKGPTEAFRLASDGYVDKAGNKLPMSAGANDILAQALGFNPAEKAEYTEAKMAQTVRKGDIVRQGGDIRRQLAVAIENGNQEQAKEMLQSARQFDKAHPAYAILPTLTSTIQQRARARALSASTATPLGTNLKDRGATSLTGFANY